MGKQINCCGVTCSECESYPETENAANHASRMKVLLHMRKENENLRIASDLKKIPGVGKNIEADLLALGIHCIDDLKGKDPEELYRRDCLNKGFKEDRCQLYVFRCAVYFAEQEQPEPEKLKWWYWKDKKYPEETANEFKKGE